MPRSRKRSRRRRGWRQGGSLTSTGSMLKMLNLFIIRLLNDTEIAKAKRDFELKKAAYDVEVQTKVETKKQEEKVDTIGKIAES